ncbi:transposase [Streptomyces sp. NPDC048527]|uniref:transposase n=1 Tax=Streptomyces sp. NPDC048527 TaxID=3365568 RepID=UPI00371AAABA
MGNKYTKRYTEEFKRDAIALVGSSRRTVTAVARELGISSEFMCGRLGVSRSGYYDWRSRPESATAQRKLVLRRPIESAAAFFESGHSDPDLLERLPPVRNMLHAQGFQHCELARERAHIIEAVHKAPILGCRSAPATAS